MLKRSFQRKMQATGYGAIGISVLGLAALLLACFGIVGVVSYAVSQRTKEIGIRMALGAQPASVLSIVLRQFAAPVAIGLALGIGGAAALSSVVRQFLYGISGLDPLAYGAAVVLFGLTVTLAALYPARRALRVDPMRALRCD